MATENQFSDSSGGSGLEKDHRSAVIPGQLELKDIQTTRISRDSGCYTGSPLQSEHTMHFQYEGLASSPLESNSVRWRAHPSRQAQSKDDTPHLIDSGVHSVLLEQSDDEDDNVFESSSSSWHDSGFHTSSQRPPDQLCEQIHVYGQSTFYCSSQDTSEGTTSHTGHDHTDVDEDDDSSTEEEFTTAEYDIQQLTQGSPPSQPIDIPARSHNSSPEVDDELDELSPLERPLSAPAYRHHHMVAHEEGAVGNPPIQREPLRRGVERPHSGDGRVAGSFPRPRLVLSSLSAATPLPDVVPPQHALQRQRAYSESAIYNAHRPEMMGAFLRDMCDEFTETHQKKRISLNLIQQKQQMKHQYQHHPAPPTPSTAAAVSQGSASYPERNETSQSFLRSLFSRSPR